MQSHTHDARKKRNKPRVEGDIVSSTESSSNFGCPKNPPKALGKGWYSSDSSTFESQAVRGGEKDREREKERGQGYF